MNLSNSTNNIARGYCSVEKSTLDSLVFFYFGFTLDDTYEVILDRILEKAYSDATKQGAFNTIVGRERAHNAKYCKKGAKKYLKDRVNNLLDGTEHVFDVWHKETCNGLLDKYANNKLADVFSYGNAQKWVNMTLKYLYLLSGISVVVRIPSLMEIDAIKKYSDCLHVPIDSFIIDVLWKEKGIILPARKKNLLNRDKDYSMPSEYVKGWSTWDEMEYDKLAQSLKPVIDKTGKKPIEWETDKWIERAKERRRRKGKEE